MKKLYIGRDRVKEEEKYKDIPNVGVEAVKSTLIRLKEKQVAEERVRKAKENNEREYKNLIKIIEYLIIQLDNDKFKFIITTDLKLKSIICELRAKLCNLDNI